MKFRLFSLFLLLWLTFAIAGAQESVTLTINDQAVTLDTSGWITQDDIEGYQIVLNSSEGIFDFMFSNQYVQPGEAAVAVADQAQFAQWSGTTSVATDVAGLAAEVEAAFSYAVDMTAEMLADNLYRVRINFGTLKQYAYVTEVNGTLLIFYLFSSENDAPPSFEDAVLALIGSAAGAGSANAATAGIAYFSREMSNGAAVIYGMDDGWVASMNPDYHQLRLERQDDASGYLRLTFITAEQYGDAVFGLGDAGAILTAAKGYNPPYEAATATSDVQTVMIGGNSATMIEYTYPDRNYAYHLFDFEGSVLLVIANYENAYREAQQAYADAVLSQLNDAALLDAAIQFGVFSEGVTSSTGAQMRVSDLGYSQFSPFAALAINNSDYSEVFSVQFPEGVTSGTLDLATVNSNYLIEVTLEDDTLAYARYTRSRAGTLTLESDGYSASGTLTYTADFNDFVDPYSGVTLEGSTTQPLPDSVTIEVTFENAEITGLEYRP